MVEVNSVPVIGMPEIHAMIQHAQFSMFDTEDPHANVPFMQVDVAPKAIWDLMLSIMPRGEDYDHYRKCSTCREAVLTMGNWVVVNFDGSLDSVLFPAIEIPEEYENEWTRWIRAMNYHVTMDSRTEDSRVVTCGITRPLDGAHLPKSARVDTERLHFGVFATPRQLLSARTLVKRTVKAFTLADDILNCRGFNSENIAGLIHAHGEDVEYTQKVYVALNAAAQVLYSIDEFADTPVKKANIINVACGYEDGLANFPAGLLPAMAQFESDGDYDALLLALEPYCE